MLIENVTHHMDEEERDRFPTVRAGLGRKQLQDLGARMMELKETAPTRSAQRSAVKRPATLSSPDHHWAPCPAIGHEPFSIDLSGI